MTDKPIRRVDINDPMVRAAIEKLRSNYTIAMLQALGGEFVYDENKHEGARGYAILMEPVGTSGKQWRLRIVEKPKI